MVNTESIAILESTGQKKGLPMKKRNSTLGLLLCLAITGPLAAGELFKWVDDRGTVHYGDKPPENARLEEVGGAISSYDSVSVEALPADGNTSGQAVERKSVIMYATSWCGYCRQAREYFRANAIPYKEYDIEKSKRAAKAFKKLHGRGVPVILIGDKRMNGFRATTFERLYYGKS